MIQKPFQGYQKGMVVHSLEQNFLETENHNTYIHNKAIQQCMHRSFPITYNIILFK